MHPLQHIKDPDFHGVFFRRVTTQLSGAGGLWPESQKMYSPFKTKTRGKPTLRHEFPSKATLNFMHMQHEDDKIAHQGLQYSCVMFDELTHFSEGQFTYLLSRLRSEAAVDSYCMASCNPDADSWVLRWVEWWLDSEGYPDPAKQGIVRYYLIVEETPVFADTAEELLEEYEDICNVYNPNDDTYVIVPPKSFTFIGGTIFDNPILIKNNPKYLAELNALPKVEKARLLHGNWYARPEGSNYFDRNWLKKVEKAPLDCIEVRGWDKASSEPSEVLRYPDYTASIKMLKDRDGRTYIKGDFAHNNFDPKSPEIFGKFRKRPGERDTLIKDQALHDGSDCIVVLPKDPGAAGQAEFEEAARKLIAEGFRVDKDPAPNSKSKLKKFEPFSSAAQIGLVYIVESSFPNKATLEAFYSALEGFDGEKSTKTKKDDWPDCTATAFNKLMVALVIPKFSLGSDHRLTRRSEVMQQEVPEFQ